MNIVQNNRGDGALRQSGDHARLLRARRGQVRDVDVVEVWGKARERLRGVVLGDTRVVFRDQDRRTDVLHHKVAEVEVTDVGPAIAVRLDAHAVRGAAEPDPRAVDVLDATGDLAADGHAVTMEEETVRHGDVGAGRVESGRVGLAGLMATLSSPTSTTMW